ncbi:protein kinase family protein [Nocardiopsis ganjiahuensis]|uniref:protein kinase family protein n=1 Tax=Nocardiopsis ganjiahuensis TaxID=239984 RepID=UPI0003451F24|nr:protein kinase family protein [Nocardiopsis ganjiahuensis]
MSTFLIEPGAKLANRYRLDHVVSETGGATRWKATDETLARPVAVWTFAEGFPRTSEVVRAARATSRIPDARVTQVFDADDTSPVPYVVEEWVIGSSLAELLAQGPMEPERAAGLVAEAAEAIAAAHAGGLHHLCLTPSKLMWSSGGAVKVTGIGVDAALLGNNVPQPGAVDAQGLGNLLYAALTGYWPGGPQSGLPGAPQGPMGPYPPGQLRHGVSEPLATITTRAALPQLVGQMVPGPPISSPAEFCAAMAEVPRLIPLPVSPVEAVQQPEPGTSRRTGEFGSTNSQRHSSRNGSAPARAESARPAPSRTDQRTARNQGGSARRLLIGAVAVALFAAVVVGAWQIGSSFHPGAEEPTDPSANATEEAPDGADLTPLDISGAIGFNPFGDTDEHSDRAYRAFDEDPGTAWNTQGYRDPLSRVKDGVGLRLDLGDSREIHEVDLNMSGEGYEFEIRVGDTDSTSLDAYESVWAGSGGSQEIPLEESATGQYVLIWFTELPENGGDYRGTVNEVEVRGT